jgi:glutathione S-transferase
VTLAGSMDYKTVAEARQLPGLRLVLTEGMPGPWAESAKSILNYKGIEFIAVAQQGGGANEKLQAWTGQTTAPVAIYNDEPVCYSWLDILLLAERLNPDRALLPADLEQRALVVGLSREIAGERGLGWNKRLYMLAPMMTMDEPPEMSARMGNKYGWSAQQLSESAGRIRDCLHYFCERLRAQADGGSNYLVGTGETAVDFYLANFMGIFRPLPAEQNPMPDFLRKLYSQVAPELESCLAPLLFEHRDMMYQRHIDTPLQF